MSSIKFWLKKEILLQEVSLRKLHKYTCLIIKKLLFQLSTRPPIQPQMSVYIIKSHNSLGS